MSLLQRLEKEKEKIVVIDEISNPVRIKKAPPTEKPDANSIIKKKMMERLVNEVDFEELESSDSNQEIEKKFSSMIEKIITEDGVPLTRNERQKLVSEIIDETIGFGPINCLINNPDVSEIMVNGPKQVYVEQKGKLVMTDITFRDDDHVMHVIEKIVAPIGRRIDESSPMVDARLPDGSRVNAIIPPLAIGGNTVTRTRIYVTITAPIQFS
ncbi:hypothetical protein LAD12857_34460 [Lacrimispora amygdalina]|uniref:Bacterial type II secretion system protein E domain-containing protein n=1 Tax=Lacrimispora amygdalina TaxID=253257 RepID=A0ABQ5M988_9FIRM